MKKFLSLALLPLCVIACTSRTPKEDWQADLNHRIAIDFNKTADDVKQWITQYIPDVTDEQIAAWTESGLLESKTIDGELKYFRNAAPNLFRQDPECRAIKAAVVPPAMYPSAAENIREVEAAAKATGDILVAPKPMRVHYTLTVDADAVPAGETIRCWLPFPSSDVPRQTGIELLSTSPEEHIMSDPECQHTTVYLEKVAVAGEPTVFEEEFLMTVSGERHYLSEANVLPYDTTSEFYKKYTAERDPHMVFTPEMKALSDSLTAGLENPYAKALAIFEWIDANFPWCSAREYSTIENISEYVLHIGHGDCGQQTLLFMTLARIAGIPTHWQSGFSMVPGDDGMHDWCEIWFEGHGWVPVDMSRGIIQHMGDDLRTFHLGSIDSWRMYVNSEYGVALSPKKTFMRSETVDFQRGEVEWKGGNLYYDQWDYHMDVQYL